LYNLSIYCYKYPPNNGVGGRRWSLFTKRFTELGHHVRVVSKLPDSPAKQFKNHTFLKKRKHRLFPWERKSNESKAVWHLQKIFAKLTSRGIIWEEVIYLKKEIIAAVQQDIDNEVDFIIVSCAPFRWAYYISKYLTEYEGKKPKLIIDIRDPWSNNKLSYFSSSSSKVIREEAEFERFTINHSDHVFFVAKEDADNAIKQHATASISWLPNGAHLKMESKHITPLNKRSSKDQMHIVFAGTLYTDGEESFVKFIKNLNTQLEQNNQPLAHWTMIGDWSPQTIDKVTKITDCSFLGVLKLNAIKQEILNADFACSYVSPKLNYAINTKIIEAAALRVPVILLSKEGSVSEFLIRNNLGVHIDLTKINSNLIVEWYNQNLATGPWQDFKEFDINSLVDQRIIKALDALA